MSKINGLLKQAELFEHLAIFGDRKSFLKSLAQDYTSIVDDSALNGSIDSAAQKLLEFLQSSRMVDPARSKLDQYRRSLLNLKGKGDVASLNQIDAIIKNLGQLVTNQAGANLVLPSLGQLSSVVSKKQNLLSQVNPPAITETNVAGPAPKSTNSALPSIPKEIQDKLNSVLVPLGLMMPIKVDGALGTETQKALDVYRKHFELGNMSGNELYNHIKTYKSIDDKAKESQQFLANRK